MDFGFHNIQKPLIALSPMDGVTDCAYREMVKKHSAVDLLYTEFVNTHGLALGIERLIDVFRYTNNQRPIVSQIYGHEVEYFYPSAIIVLALGFDGVDINMGCPAKTISDRGAGAGLIKTPDIAIEIVREVKRAREEYRKYVLIYGEDYEGLFIQLFKDINLPKVNPLKLAKLTRQKMIEWEIDLDSVLSQERLNNLTVSLKTRIGYESDEVNVWFEQLKIANPDFIALHGRTLKQGYKGEADWDAIRKAKEIIGDIPLIANGDIKNEENAFDCLSLTKADGILVGRASYGDPELINRIAMKLGKIPTKKVDRNIEGQKLLCIEHAELFEKYRGTKKFYELRKNLAWLVMGFPNASEIRKKLVLTNSVEEVKQVLEMV